MKANIGNTDRIIRIVLGLGLLSLWFILEGNARWWGLIGLVPLATAFTRWLRAVWHQHRRCQRPRRAEVVRRGAITAES